MAFADDLDTDRDNVFLNTAEFGESVTYRDHTDGSTSSVNAVIEDRDDLIQTDGLRAFISQDDVASPAKGDQITRSGDVFTITFIDDQQGMWVLDMQKEELIQ